jgi:hypothetical protein
MVSFIFISDRDSTPTDAVCHSTTQTALIHNLSMHDSPRGLHPIMHHASCLARIVAPHAFHTTALYYDSSHLVPSWHYLGIIAL